ncbi:hypothetical protein [Modestobacter sp. SSW1-42]|uniref:hypothetical protein n=1 Tax=Modestobacter sp. SSW1-42 TaxID=596372 RepID=UPI0039877D77
MRRLLVLLLGASVLLTAGWVLAPPASACSCALQSSAEQVERADVVFTGTLVSREVVHPVPGVVGSDDPAVHVFAVDTVLKGTASAQQEVVSADSSASCGLALSGDGPFLVHASDPPGGPEGQLTASLCGGTAPADAELVAQVQVLVSGGVPRGPVGPLMPEAASSSAATVYWLVGGLVGLTLLVGGLAALAGRRADRRTLTVAVLTRD